MMGRVTAMFARRRIMTLTAAVAVIGLAWLVLAPEAAEPSYVTATVDQGEVTKVVEVGGKLRLPDSVNVGAEVSGQVRRVLVDFNSRVVEGQVLLEIDPSRFASSVEQHEAVIAQAVARRREAAAAASRSAAELELAAKNHERRMTLSERGFLSGMALSESEAKLAAARADRAAAEAAVESAGADIAQARAALTSARLDLSLTRIVSPVSGVVTNRLVQPGQTIVSSFQTTPLFEIAPLNSRIRIEALVDQADIGLIRIGQAARFSVDAWPDERFTARVSEIRRTPVETQNVVNYTVIMTVEQPSERLMPGMSADVSVVLSGRTDVTRVPLAAMHYHPDGEASPAVREGGKATVWVVSPDGAAQARSVTLGLLSEEFAEVVSGVRPGERVALRGRSDEDPADGAP